ncbi:Rhamnulose-1-phosphate aldolase, partial [termite gut metagenome]
FFVTGTGKRMRYVSSAPMENGSIIRLNTAGDAYDVIADNDIAPTSELPSHLSMHNYMRSVRKCDTKVVCHTHPTDLIALTHIKKFLEPNVMAHTLWSMIPETRIIVPLGVGIVPYEIPGTMELANATIKELEKHDVVMWEKHGCLAVGDDVIETFDMIDTLSKSAQIYFYAKQAGFEPEGMTDKQLDDLVPVFGLPTRTH